MINFSADLAHVLREVGVTVSDGTTTTYGTLDQATETVGGSPLTSMSAAINGQHILVAIATGSLDVQQKQLLTVDGRQYVVRDTQLIGTGDMTHILLGTKSH